MFVLSCLLALSACADLTVTWPTCDTQPTRVLVAPSQFASVFTPSGPSTGPIYQPPATINATLCGADTLCFTPAFAPSANSYAALSARVLLAGAGVVPGTLLRVAYSAQFVAGVDDYNEYNYGFDLITFFGAYGTSPQGAAFALTTGSTPANYNYPDWDSLVPMCVAWPLGAEFFCDTLLSFNENSTTPCKFYRDTPYTSPLRAGQFDVEVLFNLTGQTAYFVSALVRNNGIVLFNITDAVPRWTQSSANSTGPHELGFVSVRSPVRLFNVNISASVDCASTATPAPPSTRPSRPSFSPVSPSSSTALVPASSAAGAGTSTNAQHSTADVSSSVTDSGSLASTNNTSGSNTVVSPRTTNNNSTSETNAVEEQALSGDNNASPSAHDNTSLFISLVVVFTLICCVVLSCTVFRRRIRRSPPFKAVYRATPEVVRDLFCVSCSRIDHETGGVYESGEAPRPGSPRGAAHTRLPPPLCSLPRVVDEVEFNAAAYDDNDDLASAVVPSTSVSIRRVSPPPPPPAPPPNTGGSAAARHPSLNQANAEYSLVQFPRSPRSQTAARRTSSAENSGGGGGGYAPIPATASAGAYRAPSPPPPAYVTVNAPVTGREMVRNGTKTIYDQVMVAAPPPYSSPHVTAVKTQYDEATSKLE